jgi:hypothetical protein
MKKKPASPSLADKILNYIRRNDREQQPPPGYKSILEWCKELGCTRRMWGIILASLLKTKKVKQLRLRRMNGNHIYVMNYYAIDESLLKEVSKK